MLERTIQPADSTAEDPIPLLVQNDTRTLSSTDEKLLTSLGPNVNNDAGVNIGDGDGDGDDCSGMDPESRLRYMFYQRSKKDDLIRMDITAGQIREMSEIQRREFLEAFLPNNPSIKTIHLSGHNLYEVLDPIEIENLVSNSVGTLPHLQELFIFQGGYTRTITEDMVSRCLLNARNITVLMMWQFYALHQHPSLAGSMRMHPSLERLTINIPPPPPRNIDTDNNSSTNALSWGCYDLYVMAMAGMPKLRVLQIRCLNRRQTESLISPEAITVLLQSTSIQSLYLENVGLIDDHVDAICNELVQLQTKTCLTMLDLKDNMFTEDTLYTFGYAANGMKKLQSIDLSGVQITAAAGQALADGIVERNITLQNIELEGVYENYVDEFAIPDGHKYTDWNQAIIYQLRLNRAYHHATMTAINSTSGVGAVNSISSASNASRNDNDENKKNKIIDCGGDDDNSRRNGTSTYPLYHPQFVDRSTFVEAVSHVSDQLGCIYYFLRRNHKLFASHLNPNIKRWVIDTPQQQATTEDKAEV